MRINNANLINGVLRQNEAQSRVRNQKSELRPENYNPSGTAKDFSVARRAALAAPDVRADKVQDIMDRIKNGTYNVTAEMVAGKIVDDFA